jgi:hypothetical protein
MRSVCAVFASVAFCCLAACSASRPQVDFTPVAHSDIPSMQQYNGYIGNDYWAIRNTVEKCPSPTITSCYEVLKVGTHMKVDGLVPNHYERNGVNFDEPFFHIILDDGTGAFTDARTFAFGTKNTDPVEECRKKGDPKLGMNAKQVAASCWGPPLYVNTSKHKNGTYEQFIYGDRKSIYLKNGIVTSVDVNRRGRPDAYPSVH